MLVEFGSASLRLVAGASLGGLIARPPSELVLVEFGSASLRLVTGASLGGLIARPPGRLVIYESGRPRSASSLALASAA